MFLANLPRWPCDSYGSGFRDLALVLAALPVLATSRRRRRTRSAAHRCGPGGGLLSAAPACASSLRTHPQPHTPRPLGCPMGRTFLACRRAPESHLRFRSPTVLSRRASVRGGRCGAANGPFSSLDTARTVRIDASFDRLASCGNPRFGALEHACGQSRGDDLLLPIQPAGVLLECYLL